MQIRPATSADAAVIARLHAQSWRVAYRGMYRDEYLDGDIVADRTRVWTARLESPAGNQSVLLAIDGDEPLGFVRVYGNDDVRWGTLVDNLHVRAEQQRRGIGRRLLAASAAWSRERYPDALLYLWVLEGNAKAQRFYEGLGGARYESQDTEPPGGGTLTKLRYVWGSLEPLIAEAR